jgi:hypothetical protein
MKKLATVLFLSLTSLALSACEDGIADISACLSMEFHRFKMGKFIFDLPPRVDGRSQIDAEWPSKSKRSESFKRFHKEITRSLTGDTVDECQLKDKAPYDAGNRLTVTYGRDGEPLLKALDRKDKHLMSLWPGVFYISLNEPVKPHMQDKFGVFKISELPNLRVKSDEPDADALGKLNPVSSKTVFEIGGQEQVVKCDRVHCSRLVFKDEDGLVYEVYPRKYIAKVEITKENKDDPNSFEIVAAEDLPETVIPILNFARSLRNNSAEQDIQ